MQAIKTSVPRNGGASRPDFSSPQISYTLQNASAVLDLSMATLRRLEKAGRLRFIRIGGRTLVCAHSLHALASKPEPG